MESANLMQGKEVDRVEFGRSLGFEMAQMGLRLDPDAPRELLEGHQEAKFGALFGRKPSTAFERKLLRLKVSAWKRGRFVADDVTADVLERISVTHCPVTRVQMSSGTGSGTDMTIDRVFNDGAYAVGNIACMSAKANHAKGALLPIELVEIARAGRELDGLRPEEWWRLACLTCMATPPGYPITNMPLFVYPPDGLLISNGFVILQTALSIVAAGAVGQRAASDLRTAAKGKKAKRALGDLEQALSVATLQELQGCSNEQDRRFALCDAWLRPLVFERYIALLEQADHKDMIKAACRCMASIYDYRSLDGRLQGWGLETGGYLA